jgi:putative copper export protein
MKRLLALLFAAILAAALCGHAAAQDPPAGPPGKALPAS